MTRANLLIAVAIATLTIALWAVINRPEAEPAWPAKINGFSFTPLRAYNDPVIGSYPTREEIDADLKLLEGKVNEVRTYSLDSTLADIPELARKHNIKVTLGAWLDNRLDANQQQLDKLIEVYAAQRSNIRRVIVGNESLYRDQLTAEQLIAYLDWVRERIVTPVSTAETPSIWLEHPELADHVDFITVHILPYWEGQGIHDSIEFTRIKYNELQARFPNKKIVIGEVGWPSRGRDFGKAEASVAKEAKFLREFLQLAQKEKYDYFVMEAFDQPWKRLNEGDVGAYWGVYDADRQPKFEFVEPVVPIPQWRALAAISIIIAMITFMLLVMDSRTLRKRGRSFLAIVAFTAATVAVWVAYEYTQQYLTTQSVIVGILLLIGMIGVIVVLLTEAHEWAEAHWFTERERPFCPITVDDGALPKVSIHVPCYNEPPQMMIETLNALAALDYPDFEVVVIDNNTKDPAVWQPVEAHCATLGERFRFFHVDPLAGFKAGALNFALRHTAPDAEIIAVIDSDYQVNRNWLRDLVPQFADPKMGIVQAPQDYMDGGENAFKAMCYSEYRGFFYIGMITRNERNAIIQHGTMTMVRKSVLEEVNGWAEWTITEDAELGLRIFEKGYHAMYVPQSYGRGVMPDNFIDFKKQRFRWAFGSMQIIRGHLGELFGRQTSQLTRGQRYHFLAGWLPWLADGFNLVFNIMALVWSALMMIDPKHFDPPMVAFSALPLTLFAFKVAKLVYLYRTRVSASIGQTIAAAWAGLALTHTISIAMLTGFFRKRLPFIRTPKMAHGHTLLSALIAARTELFFAILLLGAARWVPIAQMTATRAHIPQTQAFDLFLWTLVLLIQSIPYLAAVGLSLISAMPKLPASLFGRWSTDKQVPQKP
jgi:exo-beta-1,3-glucanase (GH17 family)/cellulose synthase/poly-beta-1,6-N-acetylglucosamine synthase-like glycosyltransferase